MLLIRGVDDGESITVGNGHDTTAERLGGCERSDTKKSAVKSGT